MYAEVAICLPLSRTFTYRVVSPASIGSRVQVQFRHRDAEGFVVGFRNEPPESVEPLPINSVIDPEPLLKPDIFELCRWIADYYLAPIGEVLKSALPPGITQKHIQRFGGAVKSATQIQTTRAAFSLTTDQLTSLY